MASLRKEFEHLEIQLEEIKSATNNFSEENVIGHGGFGNVYKGELSHSHSEGKSMVALKRLDRRHGQGDSEFHKEVRMLSRYRHENIISLVGFSSGRDEMILVYEYASRGSLDRHLTDVTLTWTQRIKGQLKVHVSFWKKCYEEKKLNTIVFQGLMQQMDLDSLVIFADIAYECLKRSHEERPAMSLVVEKLQESLALQELHDLKMSKEYEEIVNAVVPPLNYRSLDELKVLLTKGFQVNEGKTSCLRSCPGNNALKISRDSSQLKVHVSFWKKCYEEKKLDTIVFQGLMQQMDLDSLVIFADIAYECLKRSHEERPAMSLVVKKLQESLALQELHDLKLPKE
ncbi:Phloem protein 2-like protein [Artemisia annua]|uniref:Phloem protein 2-like protein n=1 Tax=Artemisia annua TaxID=35608 RepID=A0A2U1Q0S0_ARTAN|nr:Phloem protein 2-like protein [Artemisia annua]